MGNINKARKGAGSAERNAETWMAYPGMALAFLAAAPDAHGQIVYTDVDPDAVLVDAGFEVDFDGDGVDDLTITQSVVEGQQYARISGLAPGAGVLGVMYYYTLLPNRLDQGDPIAQGNAQWKPGPTGWLVSAYGYGQWGGESGYLGIRFTGGDGAIHYAWVELEVATGGTQVIVKGHAYQNTPDQAINAGDTGSPAAIGDLQTRQEGIVLAPNPAVDLLFVSGSVRPVGVKVISATGQTVEAVHPPRVDAQGRTTVDVGTLPPGTYVLEVLDAEGRARRVAFVKQ